MNLEQATEYTERALDGKQDPDKVTYTKQWNEFGQLKGWFVQCKWEDVVCVSYDITSGYTRVIGDIDTVPDYIKGKHQTI